MPSKIKEREAKEKLVDLRLRAAIASTNYQEVGEYGLTPEGIERQKHEAEFRALQQEEAAEIEAKRKSQPAHNFLVAQWSRPVAELIRTAGTLLPDVEADVIWVDRQLDGSKVDSVLIDFFDLAASQQQLFSRDGKRRFVLYLSNLGSVTREVNGVVCRAALDDVNCLQKCLNRLLDLGAFGADEFCQLIPDESQPEPVNQSADDLRAAAEEEWSKFPLWHAWEKSLESGFGIKLTDSYRRIVCAEFERANLSPYVAESYNEIRRRLVARERFQTRPDGEPALTLDERMAQAVENYNFNDPRQKAAYCHEMGRLKAILGE